MNIAELPIDFTQVLTDGVLAGVQMVIAIVASLPVWVKVVLVLAIVVRIVSSAVPSDRTRGRHR